MEDNDKRNKRLIFAVYTILVLIAIGTGYLAYEKKIPDFTSFFWGISSSFTATVFLYTILKFFLVNSDDVVIKRIDDIQKEKLISDEKLIHRIDEMMSSKIMPLSYNINEAESLSKFFKFINLEKTDSIYLTGYSMAHVFQQHRNDFIEILNRKIEVKVLLIDPDSTAGQLMKERVGPTHIVGGPHRRTLRYIDEINDSVSNNSKIIVSKMSWIPSCSLILTKNSREDYFTLMIGVNGFNLNNANKQAPRRLYSVINSTFKDEKIAFYQSNFEYLWEENSGNIYQDIKQYIKQYSNIYE